MIARSIAVWRVDLDRSAPRPADSRDDGPWDAIERERASRFRTDRLRRRFLVGRAALRRILAQALSCSPRDVPLEPGEHGRPRLVRTSGVPAGLDFNVSHSENLFLCAVSPCGRVGVDVERVRPLEDLRDLAALALPPGARELVDRTSGREAQCAFFRAWTAREALAKCIGRGLDLPVDELEACGRGLEILAFDPAPGFAAALAVERPVPVVLLRDFRDPGFLAEGR